LFALRVLAQAIQRFVPQSFLPPFDAFQGSRLPYPLLLSAQTAILAWMAVICGRVLTRSLTRSGRTSTALSWIGSTYMAASVLRIAIGLAIPAAPAWFRAWISDVFHLVLAAFVLSAARLYRLPRPSAIGVEAESR
jgi:branched-subunit amino acid ABC-type transport system permease component